MATSTKRKVAAFIAAAAVGALVAGVNWRLSSRSALSLRWPVGTQTVYEVDWVRSETTALGSAIGNAESPPIAGDLHLTADLTFASMERLTSGAYRLRAVLDNFTNHRFVLMGADVLPDEASVKQAFAEQAATIDIEPSGRILSIGFAARTPQLFKHVMNGLLTESQIVLDAGPHTEGRSWTTTAPTLIGVARVRYQWLKTDPASPPGAYELSRVQERYVTSQLVPRPAAMAALEQDVASQGRITISKQGALLSLLETSSVTFTPPDAATILHVEASLKLQKKAEETFTVTPEAVATTADSTTDRHAPGELVVSAGLEQGLLQQRIGSMNADKMESDLKTFGGGEMPDHSRWLWQTTGLLTLHPELCERLVPLFERTGVTTKSRNLMLDLLAAAGHAEAQKTMRRLIDFHAGTLATGGSAATAAHALYVQRFSLLERPDAASMAYISGLEKDAAAAKNEVLRTASLYALGSVTGHAAHGDLPAVQPYNQQLRSALAEASTGQAKESGLRALGNAGLAQNVSTVVEFSGDSDDRVRSAAAAALRKTPTPQAVQTLLSLLADPVAGVQTSALASLTAQPLQPDTWSGLTNTILTGKTSPSIDAEVANVLSANLDRPASGEVLRLLIARNSARPQLEARLRRMLDTLEGT